MPKEGFAHIGAEIEQKFIERVDIIAKHYGVGRSAVIRWAILAYLNSRKDLTQDANPN